MPWPALILQDGRVEPTTALRGLLGLGGSEGQLPELVELLAGEGARAAEPGWVRAQRGEPVDQVELWRVRADGRCVSVRVRSIEVGSQRLLAVEDLDARSPRPELIELPAAVAALVLRSEDPQPALSEALRVICAAARAEVACVYWSFGDEPLEAMAVHGIERDRAMRWLGAEGGALREAAFHRSALKVEPVAGQADRPWAGDLAQRGLPVAGFGSMPADGLGSGSWLFGFRASDGLSREEVRLLDATAGILARALDAARARESERLARSGMRQLSEAALARRPGDLPLRELLKLAVEQACAITRARYGALGVLDKDHKDLEDFITVGVSEEQAARIGHLPTGRGLLGAVIREKRTIRVADLSKDSRSSGVPAHHPNMRSFLGVPLRIGTEVFGNFYLTDKDGGAEFTEEDARVLEAFSAQAALTVHYARQTGEQRRLLDAVLRHAPHGILFFDADGRVVFGNAAAERMLGMGDGHRDPHALQLTRPTGEPYAEEELPRARALRGEVVADEEARIVRPGEPPRPFFVSAAPVWSETRALLGAVVVYQDVSAFKELERLREEFAAVVAHDLRNPLQAMMMQLELLLRRARGAESVVASVPALTRMHQSGQRLTHLIKDLLDAARIEGGRMMLDKRPTKVDEAVASLVKQIELTLGAHQVALTVEGEPPAVLADPVRLEQVMTNLLENAAKYSAEGSPIEVTVAAAGDGCQITVQDRGPGISADDVPRLFDRYYQARRAREKKSGLGLGLFITRGLVQAHGGKLWVESTPGVGSAFHVWLPRGEQPGAQTEPSPPPQ